MSTITATAQIIPFQARRAVEKRPNGSGNAARAPGASAAITPFSRPTAQTARTSMTPRRAVQPATAGPRTAGRAAQTTITRTANAQASTPPASTPQASAPQETSRPTARGAASAATDAQARLVRALAALDTALGEQRTAMAGWRDSMDALRKTTASLSLSMQRYHRALGKLGSDLTDLHAKAVTLEEWADGAAAGGMATPLADAKPGETAPPSPPADLVVTGIDGKPGGMPAP